MKQLKAPDASDVEGLYTLTKVKPKSKATDKVRITQIHGSILAKDAVKIADEVRRKKDELEGRKRENQLKRKIRQQVFYQCKVAFQCTRPDGKCMAAWLKECTACGNILLLQCRKSSCVDSNGYKPKMILADRVMKKQMMM